MGKDRIIESFSTFTQKLVEVAKMPEWVRHIEAVKKGEGRDLNCDRLTLGAGNRFLAACRNINDEELERPQAQAIINAYDQINVLLNESRQIDLSTDTFGETMVSQDLDHEAYATIKKAQELVSIDVMPSQDSASRPKVLGIR